MKYTSCIGGRHAWIASICIAGFLALPLVAQQTSAPAASSDRDEAVMLSSFTVTTERDTGYVATNTLAGSRLNTRLPKHPP